MHVKCHLRKSMVLSFFVSYTEKSEIFARTLFSRNFAYAKFLENKTLAKWQNHSLVNLALVADFSHHLYVFKCYSRKNSRENFRIYSTGTKLSWYHWLVKMVNCMRMINTCQIQNKNYISLQMQEYFEKSFHLQQNILALYDKSYDNANQIQQNHLTIQMKQNTRLQPMVHHRKYPLFSLLTLTLGSWLYKMLPSILHITYTPANEVSTSNSLGDAFTREYII